MSMAFRRLAEENGMADHVLHEAARDFARLVCEGDRTKQADKDACDINKIMQRNLETGILPQSRQVPIFGDASEINSLQDALGIIADAGEFFRNLPARARERFGNDPVEFVKASQDPSALPIFRELGLVPPEKEAAAPEGAAAGTGST